MSLEAFGDCDITGREEDDYGNLISDLEDGRMDFCVHPDCGCDGHRLCMAKYGPNEDAFNTNIEGKPGPLIKSSQINPIHRRLKP